MRILFYQDPPSVHSTLLTWTLCEELRLLGHEVDFFKPQTVTKKYDWVHGSGNDAKAALWIARQIGAKCHIHLEGVAYWRIGYENAVDWGYDRNHTQEEIKIFIRMYKDWMQTAYYADSCTINGPKQQKAVEWMFGGRPLLNCHFKHCGVDARYASTLPNYEPQTYMVTASRLEPNKKVFKIAEALALLKQQNYKIPTWVIIGYGTKEQTERLYSFCREHSIAVGFRPCFGAEKWYWIKRARLMLCGWMGIPPEEGIMAGIPVLSYDDFDIRYAFDDTIAFAENIEEYARKIQIILETKDWSRFEFNRCVDRLTDKNRHGKGELYAQTLEREALQYERIFST